MGTLVYSMQTSIDGYVSDPAGGIGFADPDDEVHAAANDDVRRAAALLFGRRMYDVMEDYWTDAAERGGGPAVEAEFAQVYVDTPRVVFSDTLEAVPAGTRLVRRSEALAVARELKDSTAGELVVAGPSLASSLLELVDEFRPVLLPVAVGGGLPFWPVGAGELRLRLVGQRTFASGTVRLRYVRA